MSHYELTPQDSRYEVTIGWDPPLANFFLQVRDREIDDSDADPITVWKGADGYATEIDVARVLEEAAKWADVPADLLDRLLSDKEREGTRPCPQWLRFIKQIAEDN